jgi:hypothetical protein
MCCVVVKMSSAMRSDAQLNRKNKSRVLVSISGRLPVHVCGLSKALILIILSKIKI